VQQYRAYNVVGDGEEGLLLLGILSVNKLGGYAGNANAVCLNDVWYVWRRSFVAFSYRSLCAVS